MGEVSYLQEEIHLVIDGMGLPMDIGPRRDHMGRLAKEIQFLLEHTEEMVFGFAFVKFERFIACQRIEYVSCIPPRDKEDVSGTNIL